MTIWAIGDLHLSFGVPNKGMDLFGAHWKEHAAKTEENWRKLITDDDLVLIPGDISWAMHPSEVAPDLQWIHSLPGSKMMIRGNHDYWWTSLTKVEGMMPPSIKVIQNNVQVWKDVVVGGCRLWDTPEYNFKDCIVYQNNPKANLTEHPKDPAETERLFQRELARLEMSLQCFKKFPGKKRLVMTHYPPIGLSLATSSTSSILEKYEVDACVFGHLHNVRQDMEPLFGEKNGVRYLLTSCDYLNFCPIKVSF